MSKYVADAEEPRAEPAPDGPSKSERKREQRALQDLAKRLVDLSPAELEKLQLGQPLSVAVSECRGIRSHGAHRRQLRWIGKLLNQGDGPRIQAIIEGLDSNSRAERQQHRALERWRDRLIEEGDAALDEFIHRYPAAERQQLRNLVRTARNELRQGRPPAASRRIFRYLRELVWDQPRDSGGIS